MYTEESKKPSVPNILFDQPDSKNINKHLSSSVEKVISPEIDDNDYISSSIEALVSM